MRYCLVLAVLSVFIGVSAPCLAQNEGLPPPPDASAQTADDPSPTEGDSATDPEVSIEDDGAAAEVPATSE